MLQENNPVHRSRKRKRGGQPGNQNAGRHGLYSLAATPTQRRAISKAAKVNTLDQEIALLRVKIKSALKVTPDNIGAISNAASLLARLVGMQLKLQTLLSQYPDLDPNGRIPVPETGRYLNQDTFQYNGRTNEPV